MCSLCGVGLVCRLKRFVFQCWSFYNAYACIYLLSYRRWTFSKNLNCIKFFFEIRNFQGRGWKFHLANILFLNIYSMFNYLQFNIYNLIFYLPNFCSRSLIFTCYGWTLNFDCSYYVTCNEVSYHSSNLYLKCHICTLFGSVLGKSDFLIDELFHGTVSNIFANNEWVV